jgi:DNA-binding transcriptional MerR regulator
MTNVLQIGCRRLSYAVQFGTGNTPIWHWLSNPLPDRTVSNRRLFGDDEIRRIGFIRHARELGFEIDAIRILLGLQDQPDRSCASIDAIAAERLIEVRRRIEALQSLEAELERMLDSCSHGVVGECRVIEALAS